MVTCYIGLGSNIGDRNTHLKRAIRMMRMIPHTRVSKISSFINSAPQGGPAQGDYLNAVGEIETALSPYELLLQLQKIEGVLGRVRTVRNAPRTIDLDILLFADICINEDALVIPHPRMREREFVLIPLREIAPEVAKRFYQGKTKKATRNANHKDR